MAKHDTATAVIDNKIRQAQEEATRLESRLAYLRDVVGVLREIRTELAPDEETPAQEQDRPFAATRKRDASAAVESGSLTDKIMGLLREKGGPMRAADITRELEARGVTTTSQRGLLPMVISSLSRRKAIFRPIARGEYELIENKGLW